MDNKIDLSIALEEMFRLAREGGDLGAIYWEKIMEVVKSADALRVQNSNLHEKLRKQDDEITILRKQLEMTTVEAPTRTRHRLADLMVEMPEGLPCVEGRGDVLLVGLEND